MWAYSYSCNFYWLIMRFTNRGLFKPITPTQLCNPLQPHPIVGGEVGEGLWELSRHFPSSPCPRGTKRKERIVWLRETTPILWSQGRSRRFILLWESLVLTKWMLFRLSETGYHVHCMDLRGRSPGNYTLIYMHCGLLLYFFPPLSS